MTGDRSLGLDPLLAQYVVEHSGGPDPIASDLALATRARFGDAAAMNIEQDQGRFLEFMVAALGCDVVVEVGTFTGMSALYLARGLRPGGRLICLEQEDRFVDLGRPFWQRAGAEDRIEVRIGPAVSTFASLERDLTLDLVFIDADKSEYGTYLDLALERLSPSGLVLVDNVLWGGAVADPSNRDDDTIAIRSFNERVLGDPTLDVVMLGIGDGLSLIRPR